MQPSDERFRLVDEGNVVLVGLPNGATTDPADLTPILDRLTAVEGDVATLQTDVSANTNAITNLDARVTALETP